MRPQTKALLREMTLAGCEAKARALGMTETQIKDTSRTFSVTTLDAIDIGVQAALRKLVDSCDHDEIRPILFELAERRTE